MDKSESEDIMSDTNHPAWAGAEASDPGPQLPASAPPSPPPAPAGAQPPPPRPPGPWGVWATLGWLVFMVLSMVPASILAINLFIYVSPHFDRAYKNHNFSPEELVSNGDLIWIFLILEFIFCGAVIALALFLRRRRYPAKAYLALNKVSAGKFVLWTIAFIIFMIGTDLLLSLFKVEQVPEWMSSVYSSTRYLPCLFVTVIVIAPLVEELIFRGFVFAGIQARLGSFWAVIFATLPWTLLHLNQYQWYYLLTVLGLGLFISLARLKTGSLYVPLALHCLNNLMASIQVMLTM